MTTRTAAERAERAREAAATYQAAARLLLRSGDGHGPAARAAAALALRAWRAEERATAAELEAARAAWNRAHNGRA